MSGHALFSPSSSHRWIECPGSFAYPNNTEDSESSEYADDGTASHNFSAEALRGGQDAEYYLGVVTNVNDKKYTMDEERAEFIQVYLDLCRQHGLGNLHFVEHWVSTAEWLGEEQGGTVDFGVISPDTVTVIDLKYGMGEKVDAFYMTEDGRYWPNHQLGLYAAGLLRDAQLLGYEIKTLRLIVCQPRLNHISERDFDVTDILALMQRAKHSALLATTALIGSPEQAVELMEPGEKTCRWCRAKSECPKLHKWTQDAVRADFDEVTVQSLPHAPPAGIELSRAMRAVGLVRQWCDSVEAAAFKAISGGGVVQGSDGRPMKLVEGRQGKRRWADALEVEAALVGQLGPKAYEPQQVISAPAAAKLLDRKKTKALWNDVFVPLIKRSPGRAIVALGSDPRPAFTGGASAAEFEDDQQ